MKTLVILGKDNYFLKFVMDSITKGVSKVDPEKPLECIVGSEVPGATRINALYNVILTMRNIKEKNTDSELFRIYTLDQFLSCMETSKYWIRTGTKNDGTAVLPAELELWKEFFGLYKEICEDVIFISASKLRLPNKPTYPIPVDVIQASKTCDIMWKAIQAHPTQEFREIESEGLAF